MTNLDKLSEHPLVSQCLMWCKAKGLEPTDPGDRNFLLMAIWDYSGRFSELSEPQRRAIAGVAN